MPSGSLGSPEPGRTHTNVPKLGTQSQLHLLSLPSWKSPAFCARGRRAKPGEKGAGDPGAPVPQCVLVLDGHFPASAQNLWGSSQGFPPATSELVLPTCRRQGHSIPAGDGFATLFVSIIFISPVRKRQVGTRGWCRPSFGAGGTPWCPDTAPLTGPLTRTTWVQPRRMKSHRPASSGEPESSCTSQKCCSAPGGGWGHCPARRGPGAQRIPPRGTHMGRGAHRGVAHGGTPLLPWSTPGSCSIPREEVAPHPRPPRSLAPRPQSCSAAAIFRFCTRMESNSQKTRAGHGSEIPPAAASVLPHLRKPAAVVNKSSPLLPGAAPA